MSFEFEDSICVLTGAASGIGSRLALALAHKGVSLALVDTNEAGLENIRSDVERIGVSATSHIVDIGDVDAAVRLAMSVEQAHRRVNLLINNAGITAIGSFQDTQTEDFNRVMKVNFSGPVAITRAFLPLLLQEKQAQIVNVSSVFGLIGVGSQTAYCASKFALRGFSEALRLELKETNVGVTVVHPGGVRTNIAKSAKVSTNFNVGQLNARDHAETFLKLDPSEAARIVMKGISSRRQRVVVGNDARFISFLQRLFPASYQRLLLAGRNRQVSLP